MSKIITNKFVCKQCSKEAVYFRDSTTLALEGYTHGYYACDICRKELKHEM